MSVRDTVRKQRLAVIEYPLAEGDSIWLREFSGPDRATYGEYVASVKDNGGVKSEIVAAMAICEKDGQLAYDWRKPEDVQEILEHLGPAKADDICLKLFQMSGLTDAAHKEAEKN